MPIECRKGHPHNTPEGAARCNQKYTDKKLARILAKGPEIYRVLTHKPARIVQKGMVQVYVFQETSNYPISGS